MHYTQAVWHREAHGQRLMRLLIEYGPVAGIIENELLGFYADRAAYPLRDPTVVGEDRVRDLLERFQELIQAVEETRAAPVLITMPTPGVILEAIVGQCDACEDFIRESRLIDLRVQKANADQHELEAERYRQRLAQQPPLLDDPTPDRDQNSIKVAVRLEKEQPAGP